MSNPQIAYFFKKFYRNIIKWWFVIYNPIARRIWPTKEEEEQALAKEEQEASAQLEEPDNTPGTEDISSEISDEIPVTSTPKEEIIADDTYNETTKSFSGRYGKDPLNEEDSVALNEILKLSSSQNSIDNLVANAMIPVELSEEDKAIIEEAKLIYERLVREAEEDKQKKEDEIAAAAAAYEMSLESQSNPDEITG